MLVTLTRKFAQNGSVSERGGGDSARSIAHVSCFRGIHGVDSQEVLTFTVSSYKQVQYLQLHVCTLTVNRGGK